MTDLEYLNSPAFIERLSASRKRFDERWRSLMAEIGNGYRPSPDDALSALAMTRDEFFGFWAILETSRSVNEGPGNPFPLAEIFGERDVEALCAYGSDGEIYGVEFVRSLDDVREPE